MAKLLQWNMRGLQANREDLSLLLSSIKPTIVALQETNIGKNHSINFQNYSFYNTPGIETNGIYRGGSVLLVNKTTPHSLVSLRTNLQATAIRITIFKTITVCSVYLPPSCISSWSTRRCPRYRDCESSIRYSLCIYRGPLRIPHRPTTH